MELECHIQAPLSPLAAGATRSGAIFPVLFWMRLVVAFATGSDMINNSKIGYSDLMICIMLCFVMRCTVLLNHFEGIDRYILRFHWIVIFIQVNLDDGKSSWRHPVALRTTMKTGDERGKPMSILEEKKKQGKNNIIITIYKLYIIQ